MSAPLARVRAASRDVVSDPTSLSHTSATFGERGRSRVSYDSRLQDTEVAKVTGRLRSGARKLEERAPGAPRTRDDNGQPSQGEKAASENNEEDRHASSLLVALSEGSLGSFANGLSD